MLKITKPTGEEYLIHNDGNIQHGHFGPSGQWKFRGIISVLKQNLYDTIPQEQITEQWLKENPLTFKNGNPRFTVVDVDHGTTRIWGNTKFHGIATIEIVKDNNV